MTWPKSRSVRSVGRTAALAAALLVPGSTLPCGRCLLVSNDDEPPACLFQITY